MNLELNKSVESYKHKYAKSLFAEWLRQSAKEADNGLDWASFGEARFRPNRCEPYYGVYEEYPINNYICGSSGFVACWDEFWPLGADCTSLSEIPTYEQLCETGNPPYLILDIAVHHKGLIKYGFEIVHKNPVSPAKSQLISTLNLCVFEISAEWILSQVECPIDFKYSRVWGRRHV